MEMNMPSPIELEAARMARKKQKEAHQIIREIVYYSAFIVMLYCISFGNNQKSTFNYISMLSNEYINKNFKSPTFYTVIK